MLIMRSDGLVKSGWLLLGRGRYLKALTFHDAKYIYIYIYVYVYFFLSSNTTLFILPTYFITYFTSQFLFLQIT